MEISVSDFLPLFTSEIVAKYSDHTKPKEFGRSFFIESATAAKLLSVISERGLKTIASDVPRGSRGNLNVFDKTTQNIKLPPFYNEFINLLDLESYDKLTVDGVQSKVAFGQFMDDVAKKLNECMYKIDRRYELQCFQAFLTGIVTIANGQNITFGRQADSMVTLSGTDLWTHASADPWNILETGFTWLHEQGKMETDTVNIILGGSAMGAYLNNTAVKARALQVQWGRENLAPAQANALGAKYQGEVQLRNCHARFWTYNDFYEVENADGSVTKTKYMDDKKIIMLPEMNTNTLTYAGIPQILKNGQMKPTAQKFHLWEGVDPFGDAQYLGVKSAGLAQLVGVDRVYTAKVVA